MNASSHPFMPTPPPPSGIMPKKWNMPASLSSYLWVAMQVTDQVGSSLEDISSMGGIMVAVLTVVVGLHQLLKSRMGIINKQHQHFLCILECLCARVCVRAHMRVRTCACTEARGTDLNPGRQ